jgi:hypothetical protein
LDKTDILFTQERKKVLQTSQPLITSGVGATSFIFEPQHPFLDINYREAIAGEIITIG